jgi:phosphopantetheine--protein transferase-like protein
MDRSNKEHFLENVFTISELDYCFSGNNVAAHLASTYSGKEAIIKAMNSLDIRHLDYRAIEILRDEYGAPYAKLHCEPIKNIVIRISLSHDNSSAVAFVIVQVGDDHRAIPDNR